RHGARPVGQDGILRRVANPPEAPVDNRRAAYQAAPQSREPMKKEEERQRAILLRLGGGFPRGHMVELFGPSGCGKTTLAMQCVARAQQQTLTAAWIDADHTFDPAYAARLGVEMERVPFAQPASAEQGMEIARQ